MATTRRVKISSFTAGIAVRVTSVGEVAILRSSDPVIPIGRRTGVRTTVLGEIGLSGATMTNTAMIARVVGGVEVLPPTHLQPRDATIIVRLSRPLKEQRGSSWLVS